MDIVTGSGLGDIAYATPSYSSAIHPRYASSWEPPEGKLDAMPEGTALVSVSPAGGNTAALANATANTKVAVICTADSRHADLVAVLQQCEAINISTIYVGSK
jgi:hypothetical protein